MVARHRRWNLPGGHDHLHRPYGSGWSSAVKSLLSEAKKRVTIQGVSLHTFFDRGAHVSLYEEISKLLNSDAVDLEILFLDPDCEQAMHRAFREQSFDHSDMIWQTYLDGGVEVHRRSTLYQESRASQAVLETLVRQIAEHKDQGWIPRLRVGLYDSAPYAFFLRIDDCIMVEQYHFGKLPGTKYGARVILGKDLPLVECSKSRSRLFGECKKTPFGVLENHLEFVLKEARELPAQAWADSAHRLRSLRGDEA